MLNAFTLFITVSLLSFHIIKRHRFNGGAFVVCKNTVQTRSEPHRE